MNYIQEMRKRNLLGLGGTNNSYVPTNQQGNIIVPSRPIEARTNPLNLPDTTMSNGLLRSNLNTNITTPDIQAYKDYLKTEPNREDYKPGKVSKILAALAGFSEGYNKGPGAAYSTTKGILDRPYEDAVSRHDKKRGTLKDLAEMEYQSLTDNQKLQVQIGEQEIKKRDQLIKEIKTASDIDMNDAQIKNLLSQAENRGLTVQKSEVDGQLYVIDQNNKSITPIGKFAESITEKDKRERNMFSHQEGIRQSGRKSLQEDAQSHSLTIEGIRTANDKDLATLKETLSRGSDSIKRRFDGMSPAEQKSAFELAFQQTTLDNPTLQSDDPSKFMTELRTRLGNIRERVEPNSLFPNLFPTTPSAPSIPQVTSPTVAPINTMPNVNINNSDSQAIQALAEIGITNPTPEQIAKAKRDLGL